MQSMRSIIMDKEQERETRFQSTKWIIDARWYYAPLAFFLGIIAEQSSGVYAMTILSAFFAIVLALNAFFYLYLKKRARDISDSGNVDLLNVGQIALDIIFFFVVILFTGGGVASAGHSFFFVPIIVSTVVFGYRAAAIIAAVCGLLILISVLVQSGLLMTFVLSGAFAFSKKLSLAFLEAGIIFLIYLLVGFFGGYVSRLLRARDILLVEKIKKEEEHVKRLEELTREFDQSAKLLVRRDLELSNANEQLRQLDTMKSEIVSIVAHQLRTPLSAIKWTLKLLLDEETGRINGEQRELLLKGFESNERMIILINDMLSVDRIESGRLKYTFVPVQFEDLVQEMIQNLLPLATEKNIRIELIAPKELLPKIKIDPDKMRDVIQNLIDNAIKYTKPGGTVSAGIEAIGGELHLWVKDNGIGIPEDEKGKIFSRFFRAGNAVHAQTDGSGLGLFIASSIIKRHGGKIWFESVLDQGTTFHVALTLMHAPSISP